MKSAKYKNEQRSLKNAGSKKMWDYVKDKLNQKSNNMVIKEILIDGAPCNIDGMKANEFNKVFSTDGTKVNESRVPPRHIHNIPQPSRNIESLFLESLSESEIF